MEYIAHRINTVEELEAISPSHGVEIDLRDGSDSKIYLQHEPFIAGTDFELFLKHYHHGTMILNVKSERIEYEALSLLKKYHIENYFFLDSTFPMIKLLTDAGEKNIAVRYSELEGIDTIKNLRGKCSWIWVDCFTCLPINKEIYRDFKDMGYKLCLVSPELEGQPEKIEEYADKIIKEEIRFDAVCTKEYNVKKWKGLYKD